MSFKSLNHILIALEQQSPWQDEPFQRLLKYWPEAVGAAVTAHTKPLSIQRGVLWVATSSAVWAQELTFGRQRLLIKLNAQLPNPLTDIRFSTAQWRHSSKHSNSEEHLQAQLWREHPSGLDTPAAPKASPPNFQNPNAAFQNWAKAMQARSHGLPLCPQCQCPTPPGELQRWEVCAICAVKQL